jgi:hypothetical protein
MQRRFWGGVQAGEEDVILEGGLANKVPNDDKFYDPVAADPGIADWL